ncbi:MAG: hypothetical protein K8R56_07230 [Candidatus Eisenbacteria bacterium]|nr:hypothetical protein [Candidatus Eisenbacteria bacterium]
MKTFLKAMLIALSPSLAMAASAVVPTLPPSALSPGQRAVVRTVFRGDSIETFEAEIVGVMPGGRAEGDLILARALGARVELTGVAQGMSGSPVYVDGKLIGALSSGWAFSREPIFGITPIAEMLAVLDQPESVTGPETVGPVGIDPEARTSYGAWRWGDEPDAPLPSMPTAPNSALRPLALPLSVSGANPATLPMLRAWFEPKGFAVVPGGRDPKRRPGTMPHRFEPGSAVAVDVMRGDLNFSAIGTVTYVDGDRVLIFGHPFFQSGAVRLPLSTASITTILGNLNTSFKMGVAGTPVGTATQDRRAAVAGRLGPVPAMLPIRVSVQGAAPGVQRFAFEAIDDRSLLSQLVSAAVLNSVMESGGTSAVQTLRWSLDVYANGGRLSVADVASSDASLSDVVQALGAPVRFLASNPYTRFRPDSIVVALTIEPGRRQATIRSAALTLPTVRPGGEAELRVQVERWRGGRETVALRVPVPEELPDGRYQLHVGGGAEADRLLATRLPARFRVMSLADGMNRLGASRRSDALNVTLWARAPEVSADGEDLPELPTSAVAVLAPPQAAGDRARRAEWALVGDQRLMQPFVVRGEVLLELVVDRQAR